MYKTLTVEEETVPLTNRHHKVENWISSEGNGLKKDGDFVIKYSIALAILNSSNKVIAISRCTDFIIKQSKIAG